MKKYPNRDVNKIICGNCVEKMKEIGSDQIDLIYFDPPFFTQKKHSLTTRDNTETYHFSDVFGSLEEYLRLIGGALDECQRILKPTGSVFLHCDRRASHHVRILLDSILGSDHFQSEIVWAYKRWSNSKKGLLNSHQIIFFYSKTDQFKFNPLFTGYSVTTNVDQILQERERNGSGKSAYKKNEDGRVVIGKAKKGVPLSDVWEIPYLNPKAKERTGYPTQKPVLLINRIIEIASDEGDIVLDPFCGSGTTCVSAKLLKRRFIGIDISQNAVDLANRRLCEMVVTGSKLLNKGGSEYLEKTDVELAILKSIDAFPVQRNSGIDGFLKEHIAGMPVPVKIQTAYESLEDAIEKLAWASRNKDYAMKIVIQTHSSHSNRLFSIGSDVRIIKSLELQTKELMKKNSQHYKHFAKQ